MSYLIVFVHLPVHGVGGGRGLHQLGGHVDVLLHGRLHRKMSHFQTHIWIVDGSFHVWYSLYDSLESGDSPHVWYSLQGSLESCESHLDGSLLVGTQFLDCGCWQVSLSLGFGIWGLGI